MASFAIRRNHTAQLNLIGAATISGVVRKLTTPLPGCPVYLFEQEGMVPLRRTLSAGNGAYSFTNMAENQQYVVMAFDFDGAYNAVLADRVQT